MTVYVALLRAVNVGGTGKLAMADLKKVCERCGLQDVHTYIQSGNVLFKSSLDAFSARKILSAALAAKMKSPVAVHLRTSAELRATVSRNPFPRAEPSRVVVFFLDEPPEKSALDGLQIPGTEEVRLAGREVFVHYPDGQGRSKLKLPMSKIGTGRNLNTVAKLVEMSDQG